MRIILKKLAGIVLLIFFSSLQAQDTANDILGIWITAKGKAHVEISQGEAGFVGHIIWLKEPFYPDDDDLGMAREPKVDRENPDVKRRQDPVVGLRIMNGFSYAGNGEWKGGTIYDPEKGKTYKCKIRLTADGALKVRGYIGFSLFGRTEDWLPVTGRKHL